MTQWYSARIEQAHALPEIIHTDKVPSLVQGMRVEDGATVTITMQKIRRPDFKHPIVARTLRGEMDLFLSTIKHERFNIPLALLAFALALSLPALFAISRFAV